MQEARRRVSVGWAVTYGLLASGGSDIVLRIAAFTLLWATQQSFTGVFALVVLTATLAAATGIGGYVAARSADASPMRAALYVGLGELMLSASSVVFGHRDSEWWWYVIALSMIVPGAFAGGRIAVRAGLTSAST